MRGIEHAHEAAIEARPRRPHGDTHGDALGDGDEDTTPGRRWPQQLDERVCVNCAGPLEPQRPADAVLCLDCVVER